MCSSDLGGPRVTKCGQDWRCRVVPRVVSELARTVPAPTHHGPARTECAHLPPARRDARRDAEVRDEDRGDGCRGRAVAELTARVVTPALHCPVGAQGARGVCSGGKCDGPALLASLARSAQPAPGKLQGARDSFASFCARRGVDGARAGLVSRPGVGLRFMDGSARAASQKSCGETHEPCRMTRERARAYSGFLQSPRVMIENRFATRSTGVSPAQGCHRDVEDPVPPGSHSVRRDVFHTNC